MSSKGEVESTLIDGMAESKTRNLSEYPVRE